MARDVVFQPSTYRGMQRGIRALTDALRPTLGPTSRVVAIDEMFAGSNRPPELIARGGIIARRIIQLAGRDEDMGAMLVRGMVCRLHEQIGDGTVTGAVLFESVFSQGVIYITSGGSAPRLRKALNDAAGDAIRVLDGLTTQIDDQKRLTALAETVCYDVALARLIGEIFSVIGEQGRIEVRMGKKRGHEREYLEGMYWDSLVFSRQMLFDSVAAYSQLEAAAVVVTDLELKHSYEVYPLIEVAVREGIRDVLFIARSLSSECIAALTMANSNPDKLRVLAVKSPGGNPQDEFAALEDLALLTGATAFHRAAQDSLDSLQLSRFGWTRRAWARPNEFGIVGGQGDKHRLRRHLRALQERVNTAETVETRRKLQQRLGRLMGGTAVLWVGGASENELKLNRDLAQSTADVVRGAVADGVLPGGGIAFLHAGAALQAKSHTLTDPDEQAAYRIVGRALAEPFRAIVTNAGYDPGEALARLDVESAAMSFDALSGEVLPAGDILDSAAVQKRVLQAAIQTAALALSIDVLVHHRKPEESQTP